MFQPGSDEDPGCCPPEAVSCSSSSSEVGGPDWGVSPFFKQL